MKILVEETLRRFPEISPLLFEGDEELSYVVMIALADWLQSLPSRKVITPPLVERITSFTQWCEGQARGKDAGDDIWTIFVIGFFEHLFDSEVTRPLIPKLIPYENLVQNAEYLHKWVGHDDYEKALKCYKNST